MRCLILFVCWFWFAATAAGVEPNEITLKDYPVNPKITTPEKFFGFPVGQRHLYHHEVVGYLQQLAKESPRVTLQEYARSHGGRPLVLLTITSEENQKNIESLRLQHLKISDPSESAKVDLAKQPAVLWMGYGVHGDEPSAMNVAPLIAYHLAAGVGAEHEQLLSQTIVLLDPCLNPDGNERFAHWANDHKGLHPSADPNTREHRQNWPAGRTNYYWFDLNRDWMPLVHPESKGRLKLLHQWKPNVLLDYHEMGSNSTYFFQPGAPKRNHPLVPKRTQELTLGLAKFHAEALDKIDSLYFSEERYDDFYVGKGSTYADFQGCIGILFEQASTRGHVVDTPNGKNTFAFTIRNQYTTSLSSLKGTQVLRLALHEHQRDFFASAVSQAKKEKKKGYVVKVANDPHRLLDFVQLLQQHDIKVYPLQNDLEVNKEMYKANEAFVIPFEQPQNRLIRAFLEPQTEFEDAIFYDISAWQLQYAYHLTTAILDESNLPTLGAPYVYSPVAPTTFITSQRDAGYLIDWRSSIAPGVLTKLLQKGIQVRVASESFEMTSPKGNKVFPAGTIVIPLGIQPKEHANIMRILSEAATQGLSMDVMPTGLTPKGIDLGSSSHDPIIEPKVAVLVGDGVTTTDAGQVWYELDRRVGLACTLLDTKALSSVDLSKYTVVVLPNGAYTTVTAAGAEAIKDYVTRGGTVVAMGSSISWLNTRKIATIKLVEEEATESKAKVERKPFGSAEVEKATKLIPGTIFETQVDTTHPLAYGYEPNRPLPVFRDLRLVLQQSENPFSTPLVYSSDKPVLSGYASESNRKKIAGSAAAVVQTVGTGRLILLPDDPLFRGYWYGTARLFHNAVFFGPGMRSP